jgi:hypothetical protein
MGRQRVRYMLPLALLGAALWSIPAEAAGPAQPGTVNYVEGRVLVNGKPVTPRDLGNVTAFDGSVVSTQSGKAEILLTPGVLLRLGDNSQVRMDSELLTNTRVSLLGGAAMVEADQVFPENHIAIAQGNATTTLLKKGLYRFDAVGPSAMVIQGEAMVDVGGRDVKLKDQHQLILTDARLKPHKFDRATEDELYAWSRLRSQYAASASMETARILVPGAPGWYGAGWYWDPWFDGYAFIPGAGFFYGPFGFPFYSPYYVGFGYYGRGFYGHGAYGPAIARMGAAPHVSFGGGMRMGGGGFGGRR